MSTTVHFESAALFGKVESIQSTVRPVQNYWLAFDAEDDHTAVALRKPPHRAVQTATFIAYQHLIDSRAPFRLEHELPLASLR